MLEIYDKIKLIDERLINIDFHIKGLLTGFEQGVGNQELLDDFNAKKYALENEKEALTAQ